MSILTTFENHSILSAVYRKAVSWYQLYSCYSSPASCDMHFPIPWEQLFKQRVIASFSTLYSKSKTRLSEVLIPELTFADDATFCPHYKEELQRMFNSTMPNLTINSETLRNLSDFCYLGSTITSSDSLMNLHIGQATAVYSKLITRALKNKHLTIQPDVKNDETCIFSIQSSHVLVKDKLNALHL